jgi:hypothetical protein
LAELAWGDPIWGGHDDKFYYLAQSKFVLWTTARS